MDRWRKTAFVTLFLAGTALPNRAARANDDLEDLLAALARSDDPTERLKQVPRLAANGSVVAAGALAGLARSDPDVRVRAAAAAGLGECAAPNALALLLEQARAGGTRPVRQAVARSLARRADAAPQVLALTGSRRVDEVERVLLVETLAAFRDDATRLQVVALAHAESPALRAAAFRALARRKDAPEKRRQAMVEILEQARDAETAVTALDAFEPAAHPDMRPAVERIATSLEPDVQEAAAHFLAKIRATESPAPKAAGNAGGAPRPPPPDDRYAPPDSAETEGPPGGAPEDSAWPRYDIVYAVDVTGSTAMTLPALKKRMVDEATLIRRLGGSHRVGVVAFRDGPVSPNSPPAIEILLPTPSLERFQAFVEGLKPRGVDERGAAVAGALRQALDRTPWRWEARREVQLLADTKCDDPHAAAAVVGFHYRADTTRTRVAYVLRTRAVVPPEFQSLARLGGTGVAELVK